MSLCLLLCVSARRGGMLCLSLSLSVIAGQRREGISLFQCESAYEAIIMLCICLSLSYCCKEA